MGSGKGVVRDVLHDELGGVVTRGRVVVKKKICHRGVERHRLLRVRVGVLQLDETLDLLRLDMTRERCSDLIHALVELKRVHGVIVLRGVRADGGEHLVQQEECWG